ncbi:MAG: fibronectin type III domain-containing protein [Saprospiraceae bacterium]|nr:fibronectin type III domain-containing protein [Candidatus Brachybacter algidus]
MNLTSLTANTIYTYCVRSACTGPTESGWVSGTFTTSCTSTTPPYTQDFESVTTPAIPACTSIQNAGTGNNWTTNSPSSYGFTSKALRYSYNTTNDANAWFFTQGLTLTTGTTYKLTYKYGSAGFDESLKVNIGTSPNAAAMTTNLADHPLVTTSPLTNTVYFTVPSNGTYYVGYNAYSIADQFYLFVDDINIIVAPTCDGPSGIVASAITQNSATISWTAPAPPPASGYDYIYSTSSTPPTGMSTPSGSTGAGITTTNLTSLTSSTLYYVWVRSVCSGVDKSNWVAMPSFTTSVDCSTAPVLSCATPVTSGNLAVAGGLLNDGTCGFSTPGNEKLYSFTSTTAGSYTLNITNVNGGFGYIDYQFKLASAGCGAGGWTCIGDRSSVGTTTFTLAAATQYFILLDAESASSTANHTFQIDCPVACPAPISAVATGITTNSANANWTPTSGDFIIEYGPTSTFGTPGAGATAGNVNNFVVTATNVGTKALLGLISSTGYSYVIRLDCTGAGNGYSANSTVRTFTTTGTPPANDECIDAINLTPTPGYFTNPGLQNMANSLPTTVTASCVTTTNNKQDVWYKLTSDNDGNMGEHINLTVTPTGTSDFAIMLYGGSCGILTELDCADDFGRRFIRNNCVYRSSIHG